MALEIGIGLSSVPEPIYSVLPSVTGMLCIVLNHPSVQRVLTNGLDNYHKHHHLQTAMCNLTNFKHKEPCSSSTQPTHAK